MATKKLPSGVQEFPEIRTENYLYIDKTAYLHHLLERGKHYFLSRPRRFGKSLFLSTLKAFFEGRKELFEGLAIQDSQALWPSYPVLLFNFSEMNSTTPKDLEISLKETIRDYGKFYGMAELEGPYFQLDLKRLLQGLPKKAVILVDEYDHPIVNHLSDHSVAEKNRDVLKDFFSALKAFEAYIHFTFVTGITKFSQVSLFSGPNYMTDITFDPRYGSIMGYTEAELLGSFQDHLEELSRIKGIPEETLVQEIRGFYNGYRFSPNPETVYNPYSTLRFFESQRLKPYWFTSGTPTLLLKEIRKQSSKVFFSSSLHMGETELMDIHSLERIDLRALMYQTGYLTLKDFRDPGGFCTLGFPNREVEEAFYESLIQEFASEAPAKNSDILRDTLAAKDFEGFCQEIQALFAAIPYGIFAESKEKTYHGLLFAMLKTSGLLVQGEVQTNRGRIDLVVALEDLVFILEIKMNKTPKEALEQIKNKGYAESYRSLSQNPREVILGGLNFSSKAKNLESWIWDRLT
jgi:hypothetical protein